MFSPLSQLQLKTVVFRNGENDSTVDDFYTVVVIPDHLLSKLVLRYRFQQIFLPTVREIKFSERKVC
jgi:hypothetical protein